LQFQLRYQHKRFLSSQLCIPVKRTFRYYVTATTLKLRTLKLQTVTLLTFEKRHVPDPSNCRCYKMSTI
jgi:hypothetical protein